MNKKVVYIALSVAVVGTIAFVLYTNAKRKKEAELLKQSVQELNKKYELFNNK